MGWRIWRWTWRLSATVVLVFCGGVAAWLFALGRPPAVPPIPADAGRLPEPEYSVTWVPGIGPRQYGHCTRILSIDGGGVRGLVPALILAEIERRLGKPIYAQFDLIAGASTGALLALGLTRPSDADARRPSFTAQSLVQFYRDQSQQIFPNSWPLLRALRRVFRSAYDPSAIDRELDKIFGDVRLKEALTNVLVPAYEIEDGRRLWFSSYSTPYGDVLMRDLARGATAALTYLQPTRFAVQRRVSAKGYVSLVDGALFANNPAPEALARGRKLRAGSDASLMLVSIGTGASPQHYQFADVWSWGTLGWIDALLSIAFSDPAIHEEMRRALEGNNNYFRLQPELGNPPVDIDDSRPATLQRMEQRTQEYIRAHADAFETLARTLELPRSPQCGPKVGPDYERPTGPRH